ncbi:MAG TPA: GrpB family protein [Jiangellaceae bacterium]
MSAIGCGRPLFVRVRCNSCVPVNGAWCCHHVSRFRYADDMPRTADAAEHACWSRPTLALRDHLRAHPAHVERYTALKQRLATSSTDEDAYTRAKTDLIQELVDAARADRGLALVPVWEE